MKHSANDDARALALREAAAWLARLASGVADGADIREFEAWRTRSEANAEAAARVLAVWAIASPAVRLGRSLQQSKRRQVGAGGDSDLAWAFIGSQERMHWDVGRSARALG